MMESAGELPPCLLPIPSNEAKIFDSGRTQKKQNFVVKTINRFRRFWSDLGQRKTEEPRNPPPTPEVMSSLPISQEPNEGDDAEKRTSWQLPWQRKKLEISPELFDWEFSVIFEFVEKIGRGGFGSVHAVKRHKNNKMYAVKLINIATENEGNVLKEIEAMKRISGNRFFLKFFSSFASDAWKGSKKFGILTELVHAQNLQHFMSCCRLRQVEVKYIMFQLGCALKYLHSLELIHCDVKMGNILISKRNLRLKLIDLGLCEKGPYSKVISGTPFFMAPEVEALAFFEKSPPYGYAADYYSAGAVLYTILYSLPPFRSFPEAMEILLFYSMFGTNPEYPIKSASYQDTIKIEDIRFVAKLLNYSPEARPNDETYLKDAYFKNLPSRFKKEASF